jgi:hypothetical protein
MPTFLVFSNLISNSILKICENLRCQRHLRNLRANFKENHEGLYSKN